MVKYFAKFQVIFENELFSICDGLSAASRIGRLLSSGVDLDITDDVCFFNNIIICLFP